MRTTASLFVLFFLMNTLSAKFVVAGEMPIGKEGTETEKMVANKLARLYGTKGVLHNKKASKRGDRVTILIDRKTNYRLQATINAENKNDTDVNLTTFFTPKIDKGGNLVAQSRSGNNKPNLKFSVDQKHDAKARVERRETFKDKISGQVTDVLPNGQLLVEAYRVITFNEESVTQKLSGRVAPMDLSAKSEVDSNSIIDLTISTIGNGGASDVMKRGFVSKVLDKFKMF